MPFLTQANYLIYIKNRSNTLTQIYWTGFSGLQVNFGTVTAHNGKRPIVAPTPPKPGTFTLTKQANPDEDKKILQWLSKFCLDELNDTTATAGSGDTLIVAPKKNCTGSLLFQQQLELYNLAPSGQASFWNADVSNDNPGMSQNTINLTFSDSNYLPLK